MSISFSTDSWWHVYSLCCLLCHFGLHVGAFHLLFPAKSERHRWTLVRFARLIHGKALFYFYKYTHIYINLYIYILCIYISFLLILTIKKKPVKSNRSRIDKTQKKNKTGNFSSNSSRFSGKTQVELDRKRERKIEKESNPC